MTIELTSKLLDAMLLEVEVVHVHIKALLVTGAVVLFVIVNSFSFLVLWQDVKSKEIQIASKKNLHLIFNLQ